MSTTTIRLPPDLKDIMRAIDVRGNCDGPQLSGDLNAGWTWAVFMSPGQIELPKDVK